MDNFNTFIQENKVIKTTIGLLIALQLKDFSAALISSIISPLIGLGTSSAGVPLDKLTYKVKDSEFHIGDVINAILRTIVVFFMVYFLYTLSK